MAGQRVKVALRNAEGTMEQAAGELSGDRTPEAMGGGRTAQNTMGDVQSTVRKDRSG